jgi:hypothetical protein
MAEDTFVATNVEARTLLAFKVPDAALYGIVPDGWQLHPVSAGASRGANISVNFVEQFVALNADGTVGPPLRLLPLTIPVKRKGADAVASMPFLAFASHPSYPPGPYGVHRLGRIDMTRTIRTDPESNSEVEETWQLDTDSGDRIELGLSYLRGLAVRGTAENKIHSPLRPDFYRIYRIEQATDVVRSASGGIDRVRQFSLKASGETLSRLFDGSEQLVSVTSVPWHSRQIFLPAR